MENKNFGKELGFKKEIWLSFSEYKDIMLYQLEDYLFNNKFNDKVTNVSIPVLGINYNSIRKSLLDLHSLFNIPQFTFDTNGCLYSEGDDAAYVSPEYFAKCFLERVVEVWNSILSLYLPLINSDKKIQQEALMNSSTQEHSEDVFQHSDFVKMYDICEYLNRLNQNQTEGLIELPTALENNTLSLRKVEYGAKVQKLIEEAFKQYSQELFDEEMYYNEPDSFWDSKEFKDLDQEHHRLFRNGQFIDPLEANEWETQNRTYDEGTDEEREQWRKDYERVKKEFKEKDIEALKLEISNRKFPLSLLQKKVIDYLKVQILTFDYSKNEGVNENPYKNSLGLDETAYYAHPVDKYNLERRYRKTSRDSWESTEEYDVAPEDYDEIYAPSNLQDEEDRASKSDRAY